MIQCQGWTCAWWLWEGGGLGDHQPGVYVPLKALFLVYMPYFTELLGKLKVKVTKKSVKDGKVINKIRCNHVIMLDVITIIRFKPDYIQ